MKVGDLVKVAKKHSQPATVGLIVKLKEDGVFGGVHHALVKPVDNESNRLSVSYTHLTLPTIGCV